MSWDLYTSLEASLKYFLETEATTDNLVDSEGNSINFRIGRRFDNDWQLPEVTIYFESETAERIFVGSNQRDERFLVILDIFAKTEIDRTMLARWITNTINDGFQYYTFSTNVATPDTPTKATGGWASLNFLSNMRVALGQNVDEIDAHRHRISINIWITE
ncbi:MAG: hypothetical protein WC516_05795 [Patescibacteria group bacterium]|jgi:hypothetical protein